MSANGRGRCGVGRVRDRARAAVELDDRAGNDEVRAVDAVRGELVEEHGLVGEDVGRVAVEVVEREEVGVEEARRPRAREHVRGADRFDVALGAFHLVDALRAREAFLLRGREVVRDRIPDRARELEQLRVERAERVQRVEVAGAGVVLVEHAGPCRRRG